VSLGPVAASGASAGHPAPPRVELRRRISLHVLGHPVVVFVLLASAIGTLYALVVPPLQVADEKVHMFRAFDVASGNCVAAAHARVPNALLRFEAAFPPVVERRRLLTDAAVSAWAAVPLDASRTGAVTAVAVNVYSCVPYLAAAAGLGAATALDLAPLRVLQAGRLANLIAFVLLVALALLVLPDFRALLLALAVMPMTLHQAASLSADALTIATAFLATAVAVRVAFSRSERGERRATIGLVSALVLTATCKTNAALAPLAALLPRPPRRRIAAHAVRVACIAALVAMVGIGWTLLNRHHVARFATAHAPSGAGMALNTRLALLHPVAFLASATHTAAARGTQLVEQLIGAPGWATVRLPGWATWLYGGLLLALPLLGARRVRLRGTQRVALAASALLGALSVFWSVWSIAPALSERGFPAEPIEIGGLAGRYFIPFALPVLLALSLPVAIGSTRTAVGVVALVSVIVNAAALGAIRGHYYAPPGWLTDTAIDDGRRPRVIQHAPGVAVEQTFRPRFHRLARIDVRVTRGRERAPGGVLRIRLASEDGRILVDQRTPLRELDDFGFASATFAPLAGVKGTELRLDLSVEGAPPEAIIGVLATSGERDVYPRGELRVSGVATTGDLHLRAHRAPPGR